MIRALPVALLLGALVYPAVFTLPFPRHVMIMIFLYGALASAWNIVAGYCGQIALGQAVFFGIGAYTSSLLFKLLGLTPWAGMLAGAALAVILSQIIGYPVFRLRGHYFAIATIAVGEIVQALFISYFVSSKRVNATYKHRLRADVYRLCPDPGLPPRDG